MNVAILGTLVAHALIVLLAGAILLAGVLCVRPVLTRVTRHLKAMALVRLVRCQLHRISIRQQMPHRRLAFDIQANRAPPTFFFMPCSCALDRPAA